MKLERARDNLVQVWCRAKSSQGAPGCWWGSTFNPAKSERRGHCFARYADDVIILVRSRRAAERVMQSLMHFLLSALKLTVNPVKSQVALMSECSFLGFTLVVKKIRWMENPW